MQNPTLKPIAVTVANGRALTGLGNTKFYELINEGKIKTITIGRRRLVIYESLEELISSDAQA